MRGPLDHVLGEDKAPRQLMLLTTAEETGTVTGSIELGTSWERLLCDVVEDVGRRARIEPDA
jgi:hypothetical protein